MGEETRGRGEQRRARVYVYIFISFDRNWFRARTNFSTLSARGPIRREVNFYIGRFVSFYGTSETRSAYGNSRIFSCFFSPPPESLEIAPNTPKGRESETSRRAKTERFFQTTTVPCRRTFRTVPEAGGAVRFEARNGIRQNRPPSGVNNTDKTTRVSGFVFRRRCYYYSLGRERARMKRDEQPALYEIRIRCTITVLGGTPPLEKYDRTSKNLFSQNCTDGIFTVRRYPRVGDNYRSRAIVCVFRRILLRERSVSTPNDTARVTSVSPSVIVKT